VLEFARSEPLCVVVGYLFQLERAFERHGVSEALTDVEECILVAALFGSLSDFVLVVEYTLDGTRNAPEVGE